MQTTDKTNNIKNVLIQEQMKDAYLDYAMSVIIGRALPDVRDGLKPVHRRILWAMYERAWRSNRPFVKSAKIVGEVIGNFHPHGDTAVYDTMVRMAQDFSLKIPLIDGQGNYGSVDGDKAAAYRYTEARLTKMAETLLKDIQKGTVNFSDNFDETRKEPIVLPAAFPNLLVNGSSGIAVGMATNIPPHNLIEVINAINAVLDNPDLSENEIMKYIPAPDFPTGGIIIAGDGLKNAYNRGHGTIKIRGKVEITKSTRKKEAIIITEIPYQVNKLNLINKIAEAVNQKKIDGITDVRDESNRFGIRIVLELKKGVNSQIILNQLYKQTQLEISYGINLLAIVNNKPKQLSIKQILDEYIKHRNEVITRRTKFDLEKAKQRAHILEGLKIAIDNIDDVIKIIKSSKDVDTARSRLIATFNLTITQADAILNMRLQRLTSLEIEKIVNELKKLKLVIKELEEILNSPQKIKDIIKDELLDIKFGRKSKSIYSGLSSESDQDENITDEVEEKSEKDVNIKFQRLTEISFDDSSTSFDPLDLIIDKNIVISLTRGGYIKVVDLSVFKKQKRGGKGVIGKQSKYEDLAKFLLVGRLHQKLLFFSNQGKAYLLNCFDLPETGKEGRGRFLKSFLPLEEKESISAMLLFDDFNNLDTLVMVTKNGIIKKSKLSEFKNIKNRGIIAINLNKTDALIDVKLAKSENDLFIASKNGNALRTKIFNLREMGRTAAGVIGMRLRKTDEIIGMTIVEDNTSLIVITKNGFGKRLSYNNFTAKGRGGLGMAYMKVTEKSGPCVGLASVKSTEEVIIITRNSMIIRINAKSLREMGRTATGVKVVNLNENDFVSEIGIIQDTKDK
jgi:DNA gyrase subunit A